MCLARSVLAATFMSVFLLVPAASAPESTGAPLRHFLVLMRIGPAYDPSLSIQQQKAFPAHAAYMNELESTGRLIFGGPLLDSFSSMKPTGAILVVTAETAEEAEHLAASDPSGPPFQKLSLSLRRVTWSASWIS
jgi:uncharacterized protein YciI